MCDLFKKYPLENEKKLSPNRVNKIKFSVLSLIEEDFPMKKRFKLKPLIVTAIMAITAVVLAITVGAVNNNRHPSYSVKINGKNVPFTMETSRSSDYPLTLESEGVTVTAYDETTVIKFEYPKAIVVGDEREVTVTFVGSYYNDNMGEHWKASDPISISDGHIKLVEGLSISREASCDYNRQFRINVEYEKK